MQVHNTKLYHVGDDSVEISMTNRAPTRWVLRRGDQEITVTDAAFREERRKVALNVFVRSTFELQNSEFDQVTGWAARNLLDKAKK